MSWRFSDAVAAAVTAAVSAGSMNADAGLVWTFRWACFASAAGPEIEVAVAENDDRDGHHRRVPPGDEPALRLRRRS